MPRQTPSTGRSASIARGEQRELASVPVRSHACGLLVRLLVVGGRVDVGAAGQDQAVDPPDVLGLAVADGRQHDGEAARAQARASR